MKRAPLSAAIIAIAATAMLPACQKPAEPAKPEESAAEQAPDAKPGMELTGGELILPVVPGRPAAVYFTLRNGSDKPVTLVSAYVEGAGSTEIHETLGGTMQARDEVEIGAGQSVSFARGGLHVMVFELAEEFADGGTTELTLSFADGDKLSAPLAIKAMAGDGTMAGMDHGEHR